MEASSSFRAIEQLLEPGVGSQTNKVSSPVSVFRNVPDIGVSGASRFSLYHLQILSACHSDTFKVSAASTGCFRLRFLIISTLVSDLIMDIV